MKIRKPSVRQKAKKQLQQKLDKILRREIEEESGSLPRKPLPLMAPILVLTHSRAEDAGDLRVHFIGMSALTG